jgi:hypothetical protein
MKKLAISLAVAMVALCVTLSTVGVASESESGAQTYTWFLSGAVMPVPPYGSRDIVGSDTASKLIVNLPSGAINATITGVMGGLTPDTTYTVYLSKDYMPYPPLNVMGTWKWLVLGTYAHDLVINIENHDGTFSGTGGYPAGSSPYTSPGQTPETITGGQVTGDQVTFTTTYTGPYNPGYSVTVTGTIAADGTMSGTSPWEWHTTSGAVKLWPGLYTSAIQPFTFTTDDTGSGSWHVNVRNKDILGGGPMASVWINGGGATILVSDNFQI